MPGIGEKGAAKLIIENGNLKNIYKNIDKIAEKYRKILIENKEQAEMSQKLSQIVNDAPIEFELKDAKIHDYNQKKVIKLFEKYGFLSLIKRLHAPMPGNRGSDRSVGNSHRKTSEQQKLLWNIIKIFRPIEFYYIILQ